ncbi:MAG: hydrogenase maturation nickel metallochaperone HypA [Gemmataceae bacterium]|nr:hydrogenase maturation nickel metallochaperone HypA [Gemmataceae bacterium]
MHELSIALNVLDVAAEEAERQGGRVIAIHLRMGPLSGVVKEALLSAYELAREISPLADADLVIEDVPLVAHCASCDTPCTLESPQELRCPVCGTGTSRVISGRELEVVALEIES